MGEVVLAELKCEDCKRYFKRALQPGWEFNKYVSVICKYNRDQYVRCGGTVAKVTKILPPGKF